ncbi:hypothetical protein [Pectinatus haikarae]|uniref:Uncharacterized protein n=1 Tax=Pectinatus haikarae TaxID=349096 RepID=A0ABT9YB29_9FIRM|nr:hypothetical protein [Pectinatus haikarae]MDQ0204941.1 hypothetical protein [Pectinatus haikarae]
MLKSPKGKITAFVLSVLAAANIFGATIASANPHGNFPPDRYDAPPPHHYHHHRHWVDGHWSHGHWIDGHWDNDRR